MSPFPRLSTLSGANCLDIHLNEDEIPEFAIEQIKALKECHGGTNFIPNLAIANTINNPGHLDVCYAYQQGIPPFTPSSEFISDNLSEPYHFRLGSGTCIYFLGQHIDLERYVYSQ